MASKIIKWKLHESIARIKKAFLAGVDAVQPHKLITRYIKQENNQLIINGTPHKLQKNVYVVGFGKAVAEMVKPVVTLLKTPDSISHLQHCVISVPCGYKDKMGVERLDIEVSEGMKDRRRDTDDTQLEGIDRQIIERTKDEMERTEGVTENIWNTQPESSTGNRHNAQKDRTNTNTPHIEILEGARDNIPDEDAFEAAKKIVSLVRSLKEDDLLLVLISGGGSALLPYPLPPLSLREKIELIKSVSQAGARITELNTLRKALSQTKGGRLAQLTRAKTISFILSDIINSPLDMIASGPTVPNMDPPEAALKVLDKYNISVPDHVRNVLEGKSNVKTESANVTNLRSGNDIGTDCTSALLGTNQEKTEFAHVTNLIIGNNETALMGVKWSISEEADGYCPTLILSSSLQGEASVIGKRMADLATTILGILSNVENMVEAERNREHIEGSQEHIGKYRNGAENDHENLKRKKEAEKDNNDIEGNEKTKKQNQGIENNEESTEGNKKIVKRCHEITEKRQEEAGSKQEVPAKSQAIPTTLLADLCVDVDAKEALHSTLVRCWELGQPLCLMFGGETTVTVRGKGRGGRNQEMVLAASIALGENLDKSGLAGDIVFLSGGTDGIDGPTDAAGALTFWSHHSGTTNSQIGEAQDQSLCPEVFLAANDSYSYFSQLSSAQYLLKPGHTGTNVMDLQILFINPA